MWPGAAVVDGAGRGHFHHHRSSLERCCLQVSGSPLSSRPQRTSNMLVTSSHYSGYAICWGQYVSCTLSICPALRALQVYRLLSQMSLAHLGRMTGWRFLWISLIPAHIFKALMLPGNSPSRQPGIGATFLAFSIVLLKGFP